MSAIRVTVSGSFRKHLLEVQRAVEMLTAAGAVVLSPSSPTVVDKIEDFVFVASDVHRSPRLVQDRHMAAIAESDFLWLVCPEGYVGQSACLEVGYAVAQAVPVWSATRPGDLTLRQYVTHMDSCEDAVFAAKKYRRADLHASHVLLDPLHAVDQLHRSVSNIQSILTSSADIAKSRELARDFDTERSTVSKLLSGYQLRVG